jgi:P-loop containing dynein motor region D4
VAASVFIHQSVERMSATYFAELRRAAYVTPTSYLELLNTFASLLEERREALGRTRARLAAGLDKLAATAVAVEGMQRELQGLQPVLEATAAEVEGMMRQIEADKAAAAATKAEVQQQEAVANVKATEAKAIADDAQVRQSRWQRLRAGASHWGWTLARAHPSGDGRFHGLIPLRDDRFLGAIAGSANRIPLGMDASNWRHVSVCQVTHAARAGGP